MRSRLRTLMGLIVLSAASLLATTPSRGQLYYGGGPYYGGGQPYYGGYYGGYHASTPAESYARGMAAAIRAQGEKNLADAQAAINVEEARSAYLDNRLKAAEAYWERKKIYDQYTAEKRYAEAQERREHRERNMLQPLSRDEFDPTTGDIAWPKLLKRDRYDDYREPLDSLFSTRGSQGELSSDDYLQAKQLIKDLRAELTVDRGEFPDEIISPSLRFLLKLDRELDANLG